MQEFIVCVSYIVNNITCAEEPFGCIKYDKYSLSLMDGFRSMVNNFKITQPPDQVLRASAPIACLAFIKVQQKYKFSINITI